MANWFMKHMSDLTTTSLVFEKLKRVTEHGAGTRSARELAKILHNIKLVGAAKQAGVIQSLDYAIFMDHGYRGLYGGLAAKEIHGRKGLKKKEGIVDHMGSTEVAANLFRTTQTEDKLRRERATTKDRANRIHSEVGKKVRQTIRELGGTMPENLPVAEDIKKVASREKKRLKEEQKQLKQGGKKK